MTAKTVKVRIAVAVGWDGTWHAMGWDSADASELKARASEALQTGDSRTYWLAAELHVPEFEDVEADVDADE